MQAMKFGFELEVGRGSGGSTAAARSLLHQNGLTLHTGERCPAHCQCPRCRYDRKEGLLAYQSDSSVAAEFVSRILSTRSVADRAEVKKLIAVYPDLLNTLAWTPNGRYGAGNHVHVGWPKQFLTERRWGERYPEPQIAAKVRVALQSLWASELSLWQQIADGGCGQHRDYNGRCNYTPYHAARGSDIVDVGSFGGSWISDRGHGTVEFRLWNTPADPKRLLVHPAISTALMAWALAVIDEHGGTNKFATARNAYEYISGRSGIERRRIAGVIKDLWADKPSSRLAADLVAA